uniref:Uncharacterized protein n=1 Tax=Cucumis melo TaxID=3656 RepID=A0A9I9DVJ2_CUCME
MKFRNKLHRRRSLQSSTGRKTERIGIVDSLHSPESTQVQIASTSKKALDIAI